MVGRNTRASPVEPAGLWSATQCTGMQSGYGYGLVGSIERNEAMKTADLCDAHGAALQVAEPLFTSYGAVTSFGGQIATVQVYEDNALVRAMLAEPAAGRVLVIDGGGSLRRALVGDKLAALAHEQGWVGLIVYGAIRDVREIGALDIGVMALNTCPARSDKLAMGARNVPVSFAGVTFWPDQYVYADEDGIVVARQALV